MSDPQQAAPRPPWSLRLAGICWILAGVVFALTPLVAALLLRSQYVSLRGSAFRVADLTDRFTPEQFVRLEPYLADFERIEAAVGDASGWALLPILLFYLCFAALTLACYLPLGIATARGVTWVRVVATVIAALGSTAVFALWQAFAAFSWLPLKALSANHLGLVLIALHIAGIVFAWLPSANAYARERAASRLHSAQAQAGPVAQTPAVPAAQQTHRR